jgi:hypothetical protein
MKNTVYTILTMLVVFNACSSSKKTTKNENTAEKVQEVKTNDLVMNEESQSKEAWELEQKEEINLQKTQAEEKIRLVPDSAIITWERGSCYGRCPVYKVIIYKSGYTEYEGKHWVDNIGLFTTHFTRSEVKDMVTKAKEIGFFEMESYYHSYATDLPSTFYYIKSPQGTKGIMDKRDGPKALKDFGQFLDELLKNKTFIPKENK